MADLRDTIVALSTAPGRAGIAVVRMSGADTLALVERVFEPAGGKAGWKAREAVLGSVRDGRSGTLLDRVLLTRFPRPHSYTGEDLAEVSLHGSPVLVRALLETLCGSGARLAEPGEFTLRAFLHGRMDLVRAEAVRDVVEACTLYQAQVAARQHAGSLSRALAPVREALFRAAVEMEAAVEFPDEVAGERPRAAAERDLSGAHRSLRDWVESFGRGRIVREGFSLAIVGRPNVGKSSLFNALLDDERSIVTETPGTTRDLVSESAEIDGIPVRLMDTAGVRQSGDGIERLGVDRSYRAMADADAVLLVLDRSEPPAADDRALLEKLDGLSCIVVFNKSDLAEVWGADDRRHFEGERPRLEVSARFRSGIEELKSRLWTILFGDQAAGRDGVMVTNLRHAQCLGRARDAVGRALEGLGRGLSEEFILVDVREALDHLGAVTGETGCEDILAEIFSRFCIGK